MSRTPSWLAVARGVVLLGLGTAGMVQQMFLTPTPSLLWVGVSLAMILGEGAVSAWWLAGRSSGTAPQSGPPAASLPPASGGSSNGS
jgi:hypothetical protein